MSGGSYNYTPSSNRWNDVNAPSHPHFWNRLPPIPRRSASTGAPPVDQDPTGGRYNPWRPHEDTTIRRPLPSARPTSPHPHVHIFVLDSDSPRSTIPRPRVLPLPYSPPDPRLLSGINEQLPREDYSKLTAEEQKEALSKLRKETYNPVLKRPNKPNYYVRDWAIISSRREKEKENEDGKRCPVCLEDFEPKEVVTLTPCSHMFHEDCIVPWVKSQGRCPVCRSAICERMGDGAAAVLRQGNSNAEMGRDDGLVERELMSMIRAMEEAFEWDDVIRQYH